MVWHKNIRRSLAREHRVRSVGSWLTRSWRFVVRWPVLVGFAFAFSSAIIALIGESGFDYSVGRRVDEPVFARVDFEVADPQKTAADREAAQAATPSYFSPNARELTTARIRADLLRLYGAAAEADSFESFEKTLIPLVWPAENTAYQRLRQWVEMPGDVGRSDYERLVESLPLDNEYVVRDWMREPRNPGSTKDFIILEATTPEGVTTRQVSHSQIVSQGQEKALRGAVTDIARKAPPDLRNIIETIIFNTFKEQPTIVFNQKRTLEAMEQAKSATPVAFTQYVKGKPFITPGVLGSEDYELLKAERLAYRDFLSEPTPEAQNERKRRLYEQLGTVGLVTMLALGLIAYTGAYQLRVLESRAHSIVYLMLLVGTLAIVRSLDVFWPQIPELVYTPLLLLASTFAVVYARRFALGATCIFSLLVVVSIRADLSMLLPLLVGATVVVFQLDEVRARTKLIVVGTISSLVIMTTAMFVQLMEGHSLPSVLYHSLWAGGCTLLSAFLVSGMLPFVERLFRTATALTLLEWRDPTRPLLQLLAREAPGTYAHSLVLGTLAEAACERIGANALLAQVGALYHDVGKIPKAQYFVENQNDSVNRHDGLSPTMSLLIILGHVKDGLELAREFKLPRVLHQFIEEHHGTTVVRYFHHVASEKQAMISTGRHDREVSESEFRYPGPTPRTREAAVLMLCDSVEGAVRALPEPSAGRIEVVVHDIVMDRLNDGQFDQCDITLREIRTVEESLVKSLVGIYHGRVAYPRARRQDDETTQSEQRPQVTAAG